MGTRKVELNPPSDVLWIAATLEDAGYSAWTVGGGVRDALAGLTPEDWDLTTAARPGDVRKLFRRTVPIGIEHGTVGVIGKSGKMFEVTTFRRDVETFGRKARVVFADRLEEDLDRRDFTINAVAWRPRTKELEDPHDGVGDLERRVLRTVGEADRRFEEDRLRVLRALRFAGRFDLRIETSTWDAVVRSGGALGNLSTERIREELLKVLAGQRRPSRSLSLYAESGVLAHVFPELEATRETGGWATSIHAADAAAPSRPLVRMAGLLHALGGAGYTAETAARSAALARGLLLRLKSSNATMDRVTHLIAQQAELPSAAAPVAEVRRWVRRVGAEYLDDLFRLLIAICRARGRGPAAVVELVQFWRRARSVLREGGPMGLGDLAVTGADLKRMGIAPGPLYGEILNSLLERVTDEPQLNDRGRLMEIVEEEYLG